ncbi:cytochrome c biogenesis protein CcsA [Phaeocystidibacter marisrubri]|uniref:Cytochrome C biogenesis protein n=1 Tax=Phaeocystidibacter marisrubri TaxID=1577780 RepID=A0A6L3ZJH7_9FLAO|nr:cytochrome c biogenesis protein CcsA [Phaeocystidibacter marisrubri]KAB2818176.1 cytochrome C biogenesis protein [Phaeocystidibacter marisrubri]GGH71553.1 cytochrome c assembly protein [Phaeocystidibacter marisrubri]
MEYIGEHLFVGDLGRFFVILSFATSILALFAYGKFWQREDRLEWRKLGRASYLMHAISVFGIVGTLFYMMLNHYYEYSYVWNHTSNELPTRYMFSSFWEGQEGSFLLWMFWHAVLGIIVMFTAKKWESSTMSVIVVIQAFLASMLLGIYIGDTKIGLSPFLLIRELPEYIGLPWTKNANYLLLIDEFKNGRGLNPLLQNYWMTIHPPTLFLGFASTLIPFAYAIGGLLTGNHKDWVKPALPWAFFSVGILGIGILMGGAWAYEALSFGGFWAWDPVENASLVPWLMMVGAAHLLLIQKNRGGSLPSAYLLTILSFLLILYSTFLTRSGILGDSSVHSFVDLGLHAQLLLVLLGFVIGSFALYFWRFKQFKKMGKEDELSSREFWMFIGAMVLLLSSLQITFSTSIPVWNSLFGPDGWIPLFTEKLANPNDPVQHYNRYQLPFAIVTGLLVAFGQFLTYKRSTAKQFWKSISASIFITLVLTVVMVLTLGMKHPLYIVMLFTSTWAVIANLDFWFRVGRKWKGISGPSVAHVGFGMILLGTLISQGQQEVITQNQSFLADDLPANKNKLLVLNDTAETRGYKMQWTNRSTDGRNIYFDLNIWEPGDENVSFSVQPFFQINERMGNVPEPSTQHYWNRDIYTHVTYADLRDSATRFNPWQNEIEAQLEVSDPHFIFNKHQLTLDSVIVYDIQAADGQFSGATVGAALSIRTMQDSIYHAIPIYHITTEGESFEDAIIEEVGLKFQFASADANQQKIIIKAWEHREAQEDVIIVQAIVFPYINILWIGCILMGIGSFMAVYQRLKKKS